jgi:hypothetical protein
VRRGCGTHQGDRAGRSARGGGDGLGCAGSEGPGV